MVAPRVPDRPVLLTILDTIADNRDGVDQLLIASVITVDSTGVIFECRRHCDSTSNGSSLIDFVHHGFLTRDGTVLVDVIVVVLIGHETSLTSEAISANIHGRADFAIGVATGAVN